MRNIRTIVGITIILLTIPTICWAQSTGTLAILPPNTGSSSGDVTSIGDCLSGDCFTSGILSNLFFSSPDGADGGASFRSITISDLPSSILLAVELDSLSELESLVGTNLATQLELDAVSLAESDDQIASEVPFTPSGTITSLDVQSAIEEVESHHTTDDQLADEVVYSPTVPSDWIDPDPSHVESALDQLSDRVTAVEGDSSGGDVLGPALSSDNAIVRFDGTTGKIIQNSSATISDNGEPVFAVPSGSGLTMYKDVIGDPDSVSMTITGSIARLRSSPSASSGLVLLADVGPVSLMTSVGAVVTANVSTTTISNAVVNSQSSQTCVDSGDANPGFRSISVSNTSNVEVTSSDIHGCTGVLSESGATRGQLLSVSLVSSAGGVFSIADTSGVQETGTGCDLSLYGIATFRYISDRWILVSCRTSN